MATDLTSPIPREDVTQQGIFRFEVRVPHEWNAGESKMKIDKTSVAIRYDVATWNAAGERIQVTTREVSFAGWPPAFVTDMKEIYARIEQDAKNNGLIGAGTDEPLE